MFNTPKHEHKSTGIASGLEYRQGYRVGGRVGYHLGGEAGHSHEELQDVNPDLGSLRGYFSDMGDIYDVGGRQKLKPSRKIIDATPGELITSIGEQMAIGEDVVPHRRAQIGDLSATDVGPQIPATGTEDLGSLRGYFSDMAGQDPLANLTNGDNNNITLDEKADFIFKADKDRKKTYAELDAMRSTMREEYDADLRALREKQSSSKNKMALFNMISAANDPNLRVGQSRVAAGAGALTEAAQEKVSWRDAQAEADLDRKGSRDEADLALKYQRADRQIQRAEDEESYIKKLQYDKEFGKNTTLIQNVEFLQKQGWFTEAELKEFMKIAMGGGDVEESEFTKLLNKMGAENIRGLLKSVKLPTAKTGNLTDFEIQQAISILKQEEGMPFDTPEIDVDDQQVKDGGRIGYQEGGGIETDEGVPMVMTYDQLRAKLPPFITDDIVKLIAHSPEAFKDFANIETQQDVEEFNDKYDVNLVLPDPEQMDYAMPSTDAAEESAAMPVPVPPAVAANPQMPMQTGTGQLTPTETALLDPTEQAIRMRNR